MAPIWLLLLGIAALCSALPTSSEYIPLDLDNPDLNTTMGFTFPFQKTAFQFIGISQICRISFSVAVHIALEDAVNLAFGIDTNFADDDWIIEDYFQLINSERDLGVDIDAVRLQIKNNFIRLQSIFKMGATNDDLALRKVLITCSDKDDISRAPNQPYHSDGCEKAGVRAHVTFPERSSEGFPIISLCDSFFQLEKLRQVEKRIVENPFLASDASAYRCQGSAMLHELIHIPWPRFTSGISSPTAIDKVLYDIVDDRRTGLPMYGPENAKMLARHVEGGAAVAVANVDNLVYAAIASYASKKYLIKCFLPDPGWRMSAEQLFAVNGSATFPDEKSLELSGVRIKDPYATVDSGDLLPQDDVNALDE